MRRPLIAKVVMVNNRKPVRNMLTKTNPKPNKLPVIITDESGSPIQFDKIIVVDEFGDMGISYAQEEYRKFGYNLTVIKDLSSFSHATDMARNGLLETKAKDDKNMHRTISGLQSQHQSSQSYYIDKQNPPDGWKDYHNERWRVAVGFLDGVLDELLPPSGNVLVIVDSHNSYGTSINRMLSAKNTEDLGVYGGDFSSRTGPYSHALQSEDYYAYASAMVMKKRTPIYASRLGIKFREWQDKINPWRDKK